MKNKESRQKPRETNNDRREFLKKSAKTLGAYGYAIYEIAEILKDDINDIARNVTEDIKNEIKKS